MEIMATKDVCFIYGSFEREWLARLGGAISCPEFFYNNYQEGPGGLQSNIWGFYVSSNIEAGGQNRYGFRNKSYVDSPDSECLSQINASFFKKLHNRRKDDFFSASSSFLGTSQLSLKLKNGLALKPFMQAERLLVRKIIGGECSYLFERSRQASSNKVANKTLRGNHYFSEKNSRRVARGQSSSPGVNP
jgi:hypothetical protein